MNIERTRLIKSENRQKLPTSLQQATNYKSLKKRDFTRQLLCVLNQWRIILLYGRIKCVKNILCAD